MAKTEPEIKPEVIQNLKDAGCDEGTISGYIGCCKTGCRKAQMKLLDHHRRCLLNKIHEGQKQIDCLDYLVYQLEKDQSDPPEQS